MIGICTDSNAQLPRSLVDRFGIEVVPLTVSIDGADHLEHVELDADAFYERFADGAAPTVSTAAPSPGRFTVAYQHLVDRGATEIVSIHIGSDVSGTLNAARLAAARAGAPVRLVDTGSASFVVGCAVWEAADAVVGGASATEAAELADDVARRCANVFVVRTLELARDGGRLASGTGSDGIPVLELDGGSMRTVGQVDPASAAAQAMAEVVLATGADRLRAGVGHSDGSSVPVADELATSLGAAGVEVVRYRVGPSVGAHTGPGTAGVVFYRRPHAPSPG